MIKNQEKEEDEQANQQAKETPGQRAFTQLLHSDNFSMMQQIETVKAMWK